MKFTEFNMVLTAITLILFIIYGAIKFFRNHIIRPTFSIIDKIYNDFYDIYFKDVTSSRQYSFLGEIYSTMLAKFTESSISDDDVKKYIDYLDEGSRQYWFLPVISVLASFLGISNMESLVKLVSENKIFNIEGSTGKIDNVVKFLENITNSKNFKLYNYDYILRKENEIEFKLEIKYF